MKAKRKTARKERSKPDRELVFRGAQTYAIGCPTSENGNSGITENEDATWTIRTEPGKWRSTDAISLRPQAGVWLGRE
jgi:hypothetical protein